ncbi:MAG TPA: sugar ABC transporter ATP-binding protein [Polyangiaceae bacterium]|jgi:D-xylose transport system ATP-binding protein|nr:sugar ABC transporter ATP-binding protein [Polyangiaceae bacterium]
MSSEVVLATRRLSKRFGGVIALRDIDFELRAGEVHALCGENGAGKSTLIKLLGGIHPAGSYDGEITIGGRAAHFETPRAAERAGISVIYQELALVSEMTVAENLLLGSAPQRFGLIDWNQVYARAKAILEEARIELDPTEPVQNLGVARRQLVEIAKAIGKKSKVLILDEPTAALSEQEVRALLDLVRRYRESGISCIYISHKLDEVFAVADRITVLRDGKSIVTLEARETSQADVIRHMVGREISDLFPRGTSTRGKPLLRVEGLSVAPAAGKRTFLRQIAFEARAGEVLGIGGLMGAGRTELLLHLFGAWGKRVSGRVELAGTEFEPSSPEQALARGLALVSEDRKRFGLILDASIGYHLTLSSLRRFVTGGLIDAPREYRAGQKLFDSLRIKARDLETSVAALSGGNQQKVVLGKALLTEPQVLLLDEPTRGIDVGAKIEVYGLVNQLTEQGKAVVLVSSELSELIGMSDRILMLHEGEVAGVFERGEFTQERLLAAALGKGEPAVESLA